MAVITSSQTLTPQRILWLPIPFLLIGAIVTSKFADSLASPEVAMLFNVLMALPLWFGLRAELNFQRCLGVLLALSLYAYAIETIGVLTSWPYGGFFYGEDLGPKILNTVPILLPFSYVPLVIAAASLAGLTRRRIWFGSLMGTLFLVAFDLVLDPGATRIGYWVWEQQGIYYGVPFSNFLGWLLTSYLAMRLLRWLLPRGTQLLHPFLLYTYFWGLCFWTSLCAIEMMWLPFYIGLGLVVLTLVLLLQRQLRVSHHRGGTDPQQEERHGA